MSKPSSPKSPNSPKDGKPVGEKMTLDLGELMQRLDKAVAISVEDNSELFITNVQEQRALLEDCRDYIYKLDRENAGMAENFRHRDEEAFAIQEMQTEKIAEEKARIEDLEAQRAQKVVDIEELQAHYETEMRKIIEEERLKRRQLTVRFGARVEELHNRLASVKSFIERQDEVEARMEAAEKETVEMRAQIADLAPGFERKYIENCLAYKEEIDKKLEDFMFKVKEDIGNRVGDRVKEVLGQNEILLSEIRMHTSSTSGLQEEVDKRKAENRKLRGEIDLKNQAEELQIKRSRHQRHVIRHHESKIRNLEKSLQQVNRQFSEERRILQEKHAYIVAELKADNMRLKSLVTQKAKELKKLRHLAEIVVRQRGEVELFLLDSIQHVKNQIYLQKKFQSYQTADHVDTPSCNVKCAGMDSSSSLLVSTFPSIHKAAPASWPESWPQDKNPELQEQSNNNSSNNKGGINGANSLTEAQLEAQINFLDCSHDHPCTAPVVLPMIDISALSWEEREKVLRYLFKKIHTARNHQLPAEDAKSSQPEKFQGSASTEAARTIV